MAHNSDNHKSLNLKLFVRSSLQMMKVPLGFLLLLLIGSAIFTLVDGTVPLIDERKAYIVYLGDKGEQDEDSISSKHANMLREIARVDDVGPDLLMHSYRRSFDGFAALLTEEEALRMAGLDGVVSVFLSRKHELQTSRSWDFIGLSRNAHRSTRESDIIIGVFDTGIWPESHSFTDVGFGLPPAQWRGRCLGPNFVCNRKLIGATYYKADGNFAGENQSPRDTDGHGTHTASTAAGNVVDPASLYGLGQGAARGAVPSARIASYKICWGGGCSDADILKAFDDAIDDGVDIISLSVGHRNRYSQFFNDSISIGSFHAMKRGILTSHSAGNAGPRLYTSTSSAPWTISVAASTIDRKFVTQVISGNGRVYQGVSVNTFNNTPYLPVILGRHAPNVGVSPLVSTFCVPGSLNPQLVRGKIVVCDWNRISPGFGPFHAGAAGYVSGENNMEDEDRVGVLPLPSSYLSLADANAIASNPTASIQKSIAVHDHNAPRVAMFSSRGPNHLAPDILKPDIAAPGVNILAAWTGASSATGYTGDTRFVPYNIISGTSMACPHVSGAAAYVKSFHPTWSPAAIKSALMTTARPMSSAVSFGSEFAYGSGNLLPVRALDPGLVYDSSESDYINFLCGLGYSTALLRLVTGDSSTCPSSPTAYDLNYPSFSIPTRTAGFNHTFRRTVTNVGPPSRYVANLPVVSGIFFTVNPGVLQFTQTNQRASFEITVSGVIRPLSFSTSLVWDDGTRQVRSPIVIWHNP